MLLVPLAAPLRIRFDASRKWIHCASLLCCHTLLQAYSAADSLLLQLGWIGLSLAHHYSKLIKTADVVREAAAFDSSYREITVEWLGEGRSNVWGE